MFASVGSRLSCFVNQINNALINTSKPKIIAEMKTQWCTIRRVKRCGCMGRFLEEIWKKCTGVFIHKKLEYFSYILLHDTMGLASVSLTHSCFRKLRFGLDDAK